MKYRYLTTRKAAFQVKRILFILSIKCAIYQKYIFPGIFNRSKKE